MDKDVTTQLVHVVYYILYKQEYSKAVTASVLTPMWLPHLASACTNRYMACTSTYKFKHTKVIPTIHHTILRIFQSVSKINRISFHIIQQELTTTINLCVCVQACCYKRGCKVLHTQHVHVHNICFELRPQLSFSKQPYVCSESNSLIYTATHIHTYIVLLVYAAVMSRAAFCMK